MRHSWPFRRAFTLIELLIVVAILAVLATVAMSNFLEAQTRSKISRVSADLRTYSAALETYFVDTNHYPVGRKGKSGAVRDPYDAARANLADLTTPIAYLSAVPWQDPFLKGAERQSDSYSYFSYSGLWGRNASVRLRLEIAFGGPVRAWSLVSVGPDRRKNGYEWFPIDSRIEGLAAALNWSVYDPTNGTKSSGDVGRWGGEITGPVP
ncbi:prepilin-type N-terminal cleavage/methylation domain-containing protein [bacterium]|nr:prepilin-type N-terminal cleavage/methylation domain-containing protein [bacterium]